MTDALNDGTSYEYTDGYLNYGPVELKRDLPVTGLSLPASTGEQEESYDRPAIECFDKALR